MNPVLDVGMKSQRGASIPSPLASYPLTSNANDISGNGYHGTNVGSVTFSAAGAVFNGANQTIKLPQAVALASGTIVFDFKAVAGFKIAIGSWADVAETSKQALNFIALGGNMSGSIANEAIGLVNPVLSPASARQEAYNLGGTDKYNDNVLYRVGVTSTVAGAAGFNVDGTPLSTVQPGLTKGFLSCEYINPFFIVLGARKIYFNGSWITNYYAMTLRNLKIFSEILTAEQIALV